MPWRYTDLPYLRKHAPDELRETIRRYVKEHEGRMLEVATSLGVSKRILYRYLSQLGMTNEISTLREQFQATPRRVSEAVESLEALVYNAATADEARGALRMAFEDCGGDTKETARALGISLRRLYQFAEHLGINEILEQRFDRSFAPGQPMMTPWTRLVHTDPAGLRTKLEDLLAASGGRVSVAAKKAGVSMPTFYKYLRFAGLGPGVSVEKGPDVL